MSRTIGLSTNAFSAETFLPVKLSGVECVNELYCYELIVKTPDADPVQFYAQNGARLPYANVDVTGWLGQEIAIGIELDGKVVIKSDVVKTIRQSWQEKVGQGVRHISGIISSARYLYDQGRSSYYLIELSPFLSNATLKTDCKIFQDKTVIEILDEVLLHYPGKVIKRLEQDKVNRYPKRDYQTQFLESDFQFFARLCSEWGINYWFEHGTDGHTLVLSDETNGHQKVESEAYHIVAYYPLGHKIEEEYLHDFSLIARKVSGAFASADYDYTQAHAEILANKHNVQPYPDAQKGEKTSQSVGEIAQLQHEVYEFASDVAQPKAGVSQESNEPFAEQNLRNQWQLERLQQQHFTAMGKGNIRGIAAGHRFRLEKHPSRLANIEWVVTRAELLIMDLAEESQRADTGQLSLLLTGNTKDNGSVGGISKALIDSSLAKINQALGSSNQKWQIECALNLIPANVPVRPTTIEKPKASLQTALVVGDNESGSIYTDEYGRIKVQFHWDRYGSKDQNSSCWIRVNEPWAGNQMGAVFTPRLGQEVLIDFINHDPDLPICIGKVNNGDNLPNWRLAQNLALSGFRSRELGEDHAGNDSSGRSNHLIFDDTEGKIHTQLKSDHAASQLALGSFVRVEDNAGRKDARGQGFELRTDDWGATRAAKGLYLSTYERKKAASTHMDATEPMALLQEAKELVERLSKLAEKHEAEQLTHAATLDQYRQAIDVKTDIEGNSVSPEGFSRPLLLGAGEAGIALVTPEETQHYSGKKHAITAGEDINLSSGHSLIASAGVHASFFAQQTAKLIAGQGEVQVKADNNDIKIIADKSVQVTAVNNKVLVNAEQEIMLACGGAYIKLSGGNIYLHAPGTIEHKGAAHPFMGPTSENIAGPHRNAGKGELDIYHLYANKEGAKESGYKVIDSLGAIFSGLLDKTGYAKVSGLAEGGVKAFVANDGINPMTKVSELTQNLSFPPNLDLASLLGTLLGEFGSLFPESFRNALSNALRLYNQANALQNGDLSALGLTVPPLDTDDKGIVKPRPDGTVVMGIPGFAGLAPRPLDTDDKGIVKPRPDGTVVMGIPGNSSNFSGGSQARAPKPLDTDDKGIVKPRPDGTIVMGTYG